MYVDLPDGGAVGMWVSPGRPGGNDVSPDVGAIIRTYVCVTERDAKPYTGANPERWMWYQIGDKAPSGRVQIISRWI